MVQFAVESEDHVVNAIELLAERMQCLMPGYSPEVYSHSKRMGMYAQLIATQLADTYQFSDEVVEQIGMFTRYHALSDIKLPADIVCNRRCVNAEQEALLTEHIEQCGISR